MRVPRRASRRSQASTPRVAAPATSTPPHTSTVSPRWVSASPPSSTTRAPFEQVASAPPSPISRHS